MINQKDSDHMHLLFGQGDLLQSIATDKVKDGDPMLWFNEHTKGAVGQSLNISTADLLKEARVTMSFGTPQSLDVLLGKLLSVRKIQFPTAPPFALPAAKEPAKAPPPLNPMHRRDEEQTHEDIGL